MFGKKRDLGAKECSGVGMEGGKGKYMFIKDNIPRDINTPFFRIKTFESLVHIAITQEHTLFGSEG